MQPLVIVIESLFDFSIAEFLKERIDAVNRVAGFYADFRDAVL